MRAKDRPPAPRGGDAPSGTSSRKGGPCPRGLASRHHGILVVLWLQVVGLLSFGLLSGSGLWIVSRCQLRGLAHAPERWGRGSRRVRAVLAGLGLITASRCWYIFWGLYGVALSLLCDGRLVASSMNTSRFAAIGYVCCITASWVFSSLPPVQSSGAIAHPWQWAACTAPLCSRHLASIVNRRI